MCVFSDQLCNGLAIFCDESDGGYRLETTRKEQKTQLENRNDKNASRQDYLKIALSLKICFCESNV